MGEEKKIQHRVVGYAGKHGILALKVNIGSQKGWPDYLFIDGQGYHFWIEFKAPGKEPTPLQAYRAAQLADRGVAVFTVDNYEHGKKIIDAVVASRLPEESYRAPTESG